MKRFKMLLVFMVAIAAVFTQTTAQAGTAAEIDKKVAAALFRVSQEQVQSAFHSD